MKNITFKRKSEILFLIMTLLIFAACNGLGTAKSSQNSERDPVIDTPPSKEDPSPEATRIICFQLSGDRSEIIGYFGIDDNGESCPKAIVIPDGISSIGNAAFQSKALTSVLFPQSLITIGNNAFQNNSLTSLVIPDSVTSIGDSAFTGNLGLGVVYVPNSSPVVANNAFPNDYVFGGTRFSCFVTDNTSGITITNYLNSDSDGSCPKSVIIPQRMTSIGASAFQDSSLTSITIAESVTNIGANAFLGNSFSYIYIPNGNATVDATAFDSNVTVVIAEATISISSPPPISRANMSSYSLSGTCFYNNQPVTAYIKGQIGDSTIPPKLASCTNKAWSVNHFDLSNLSNGDITIEVVHLSPNGKGYTVKATVTKSLDGVAVSIDKNNLSNIVPGVASTYTLTGTCTEVGEDVAVEVNDGTHTETPSPPPSCQAANPVGEWSTSFDHSRLSEGTLTITVTHTSSTTSDTVEIIKDVTLPSVTIANTAGERVSTGTYSLNGTCSEIDSDVEVTLTDSSPREITTTASCTNNSGSRQWEVVNLDISSLADGDINISVTQDDEVGNTGEATLTISKGPAVVGPIDPVVGSGCADTDFSDPAGQDGSFGNPYIVCNAVLLSAIRNNTATGLVIYKLEQDIDLEGATFEPLGAAGVNCSETGAFIFVFNGNGKKIVNYKVPMSRQDYYHPTDRSQDIFGRCVNQVSDLTVNPGSSGTIEFCDLFDFGPNEEDVGLTTGEEQADGSFTMGPRILCSLDQIHAIDGDANNLSKDYTLYKDIDLENVEYSQAIINGDYTGTFDGNNKTIRNLNINSSSLHVGFFKRIQQGGIVKNLKFENINIKSTNGTGVYELVESSTTYNPSRLGVLAAEVREGSVVNCSVTDSDADVDVLFENSSSSGVTVGGLIGYGLGLDIEDSFSEGLRIKVVASNAWPYVGGLVGHQGVCLDQNTKVL